MRLTIALVLTAVIMPLHRNDYQIDLRAFGPVLLTLGQEILIGVVLGMLARLTIASLQIAGSVVAQQMGLGFVTAVDPTQGQQGVIVGNFLGVLGVTLIFATDMHHLVIAALNDSYTLFKPGRGPDHRRRRQPARPPPSPARSASACSLPRRSWCSACCSISGLGVLSRLMPQMQVFFVGMPLSILVGFLILLLVIGAMMMTFLDYVEGVLRVLAPNS